MSAASTEFADRVVVVTGGARGVGRAISSAFARRGAHVVVNYFHATAEAPRLVEELTAAGASVEALRASVARPDQVELLFEEVERRHGGVDVLVNNAASGALLPLDQLHDSHWQRAVDTNLRGTLRCSSRAAPLIARRGGGAIVNLSSIGASQVIGNYATVGTTKAAVEALTRYLAVEFAAHGIRVNTASGGLLDGTVAGLFPDARRLADRVRAATPLGRRLGREEELAELVVFLASPAASWITGQTVVADGGLSLGAAVLGAEPLIAPPPPAEPPRCVPPVSPPVGADAAPGTPPARTGGTARPTTTRARADDDARIAVVGSGVVTPGANDPERLWTVLSEGRNVFRRPVLFDVDSFYSHDPSAEDRTYSPRSGFITDFQPHPRLAAELADRSHQSREATTLWLRHCLHTALDGVRRAAADRCLAAFGYTADGSQDLEAHLVLAGYLQRLGPRPPNSVVQALRRRYDRLGQPAHEFLPHRVGRNAVTGILPDDTEVLMVDTACSSSLYALDIGVKALRAGEVDLAVCGGAFAYTARDLVLFSKLQGLSRLGTVRCFDRAADGVLFSDGAGVVVLKRLARARADGDQVLGVVEGLGLAGDGRGKAIYAPNAAGQALALRRAYRAARVDPADVGWVIAHATGTRAGDSTELAALREVAGDGGSALLSSNKAVVGHTGWAAGVVSVCQALTGLARGEAPAQPYLVDPIDAVRDSRFHPPAASSDRALPAGRDGIRRVAVSSFGFGGTDSHLILAEDTEDTEDTEDRRAVPAGAPPPEDIVVLGWATDLPGGHGDAWLRGAGSPPATTFGEDYPLPGWREVRLPPATLRGMDRTQIMVLRAAAALPAPVQAALDTAGDTTGVVIGHLGPTRRAVHHALRCYLGDVDRALSGGPHQPAHERDDALDRLGEEVRALVPAATEDSFPGIMPNIIASRLASDRNFRGLAVTVDGGPDSGLDALRTAERYLRHGDLDFAVVGAVNGNSTEELRRVLETAGERDTPAEGAFLVVLARETTARTHALPALARLRTRFGAANPSGAPRQHPPLAGSGRTYLGADPLVALVAHLSRGGGATTISSHAEMGPRLDVASPNPPAPPPPAPNTEPAGTDGQTSRAPLTRAACQLDVTPPRQVRRPLPALPGGSLVVCSHADLAPGSALPADATVVLAPRPSQGGAQPTTEALAELLPATRTFDHVRVLVRVGATAAPPAELSTLDQLRAIHDLAFLAARRWRGRRDSSYAVLLVDSLGGDALHPATGPFTGLVKALAREMPTANAFAVATDSRDPVAALDLLALESARAHDLAVVAHSAGRRREYRLLPATEPAPTGDALPPGGVIVAAGGTRGLTARLLTRLAAETEPAAVYLFGRNAPGGGAPPDRAAFLTRRREEEPTAPVARLVAERDRLVAAATTARTVRELADHLPGGRVHFVTCDLTDPDQTRDAVRRVLAAHGGVDLLLNAAGRHSGGRVATTSPRTARAVRDTKLLAYLNLRAAFAERPPARWLNLGSLLAVLGWPGEADYCAANDVLNATALWRAACLGGGETTIASPLWDESGFAAEPVVRGLLRRQGALTGVSDREGTDLVLDELRRGLPTPLVTHLGAAERRLLATSRRHTVEVAPDRDDPLTWRFDPELDDYFRRHRLHGAPTLPGAWVAEIALAATGRPHPAGHPLVITDLRFHAPLVLPAAGRAIAVRVDQDLGGLRVRLHADVVAHGRVLRRDRLHAEATIGTADHASQPTPTGPPAAEGTATRFRYGGEGPVALDPPFSSLTDVHTGPGWARATFRPHLDPWAERLAGLRLPVLLLDALVQCCLLADRVPGEDTGLPVPAGVDRIEVRTEANDTALLGAHPGGLLVHATTGGGAAAFGADGRPLALVRGVSTPRRPHREESRDADRG